ncbi:Hydantoinase/oxoprolinase [Violaceomyces palustris]|uniref:Hydantoinase/oxoprolinase n=1 Tax=Violaceomyces palustris TaxID=1673888 RepID=A0ACD0NQI6_9BASI|nr:Hydantoinase/oxoprolinase [Violaceomyces palustris]
MSHYCIGIDVGGTNTDAVLLNSSRAILSTVKTPTTKEPSDAIQTCLKKILRGSFVDVKKVRALMIGTTHFINAVLQNDASKLARVAVLRLAYPYTTFCPPFVDIPAKLRSIIQGHYAIIKGGKQISGEEISKPSRDEIRNQCVIMKEKGLHAIVIVGVFSSLEKEGESQEELVASWIREELGDGVDITCSRSIGPTGLLERENASILNASMLRYARHIIRSFVEAIRRLGLESQLYLTKNDGTLATAKEAAQVPIKTFSSGATNSMRGASFLSRDFLETEKCGALVIDVGGTSSDCGALLPNGSLRQAAAFVEVGGVRTNFPMPDVSSIGLGGGSIIKFKTKHAGGGFAVEVGPSSVGYRLASEAVVFGGNTLTATDIVAASGSLEDTKIGDHQLAEERVSPEEISLTKEEIKVKLERLVAKMKTSPEPVPLILVGGGSIIAPEKLKGCKDVIRPPHYSCANAVGAAVALVSGVVDTIEVLEGKTLEETVIPLKAEAIQRAVLAGAKEETVEIVEVESIPVQYVTNKTTRIIVRATGELSAEKEPEYMPSPAQGIKDLWLDDFKQYEPEMPLPELLPFHDLLIPDHVMEYKPCITEEGEWQLSELDLFWIQEGCGILGTGGGGTPYSPYLMARHLIVEGHNIRVVELSSLEDSAMIARTAFMGSPSISSERLAGEEAIKANILMTNFTDVQPAAVISEEIGGGNGIEPMILASSKYLDVPVVDADNMARAYPNMWQSLLGAYDVFGALTPCAISDACGNSAILASTSTKWNVENILRTICTELGSSAATSHQPLAASVCKQFSACGTLSQAWRLGRALSDCRKRNDLKSIPRALTELQSGNLLFSGKIMNVEREVREGFTWGFVKIVSFKESTEEDVLSEDIQDDGSLMVEFQNEYLCATLLGVGSEMGKVQAIVPDLICLLDSTGIALGTPEVRYGLRVSVIALANDPKWTTTEEGLRCGGPKAFGFEHDYVNMLGEYKQPRSVIEEYMPKNALA